MKIAIVGGLGFVGHHLGPALKRAGHEVLAADFLAINNFCNLLETAASPWKSRYLDMINERLDIMEAAGIEYRYVDARDYHKLSQTVGAWRPSVIIHLAAVAHIDRSKKDPRSTFDHSLRTLENALDVAVAVGCKHFIYFSSSTVYGNFTKPTVDEDEPANPTGAYGSLKAGAELMVKAYRHDKDLSYTIVRPQALYGPRCVSRRVTQIFIENALSGIPLRVNGDGTDRHDFTYIDDLVSGVLAIVHNFKQGADETFCLTSGASYSTGELAKMVAERIPAKIVHGPADPDKPSRGAMSTAKAKRLLGWEPQYLLPKGMSLYMDWYDNFLSRGHNGPR